MRPNLIEQLNNGINNKLTLVSASAGFGKTILLTQWLNNIDVPVAWVSLDSSDSDIYRFLAYVVSALKKAMLRLDSSLLEMVQLAQPPSAHYILTKLINAIHANENNCILVLDDYHLVDNVDIDNALDLIIKHMPDNFHIVIATREDPNIPLAKLRAERQITELRTCDLKFSAMDIQHFFREVMDINLTQYNIKVLEGKTEGWIAGLQLAGISLKSQDNIDDKIQEFTGEHRYILDYLVNEVLNHQSEQIKIFLIHTSILRQMNIKLCQYVLEDNHIENDALTALEQSNLFLICLDETRTWYRYHHLFSDLLKQRLSLHYDNDVDRLNGLHIRASKWHEREGNIEEAFYHAICTNDIKRVLYLLNKTKTQRHNQAMNSTIISWVDSLDEKIAMEYPELYIWKSSFMLIMGMTSDVSFLLTIAEQNIINTNEENNNLLGRIAAARATLALTKYDISEIIKQATLALDYLGEGEISYRTSSLWTLGYAYQMSKEYDKARTAYCKGIKLAKPMKDKFNIALCTIGLGNIYEAKNQQDLAYKAYNDVLVIAGKRPLQYVSEVHMGLSRIYVQQGEVEKAESHAITAINLAKQYDNAIDRFILCEIQLANVKLAKELTSEAIAILLQIEKSARTNGFTQCFPMVAEALVKAYLQNNDIDLAKKVANKYQLQANIQNIIVDRLTPREMEILKLIEKGLSNREIGGKLFLALDTVKGHNRRIFEKLQVSRRIEAVAKAKELNIL